MTSSFESVKRRLRFLRNVETVCVFLLPAALVLFWSEVGQPTNWPLRLAALFLVAYILAQGSFYWHLKLRAVAERAEFPSYFVSLFRFFRRSNVFGIAGVSLFIVLVTFGESGVSSDVAWSVGVTAFALLEHVNYYAYQLTHDTASDIAYLKRYKRLRRASLAKDLKAASAGHFEQDAT